MRILHISPFYFPALGGAELHVKEISERLASRGHDVTVVTANVRSCWGLEQGRHGALPEVEVINGVKVVRFRPDGGLVGKAIDKWLRLKGGYRSANLVLTAERLEMLLRGPRIFQTIRYILSCDAHLVASMHWYCSPSYYTYLARRFKRFTLVGFPHFHTADTWSGRPIYQKMLASCDALVVNTTHEANFIQERVATRVEVAGVGVDPISFEGRDGGAIRQRYRLGKLPVVGFVGRQTPDKGVVKLLEAMKVVWKWNHEVRLLLAGTQGNHPNLVNAFIEGLSEYERERIVRINNFQDSDKPSIFDALDVLALPSTAESFGISYLEAWLCKKPVIGARIGSTQCVIREGVDGLLVDPKNHEEIAQAIIGLLSNPDIRDRMGTNGFAKTIAHHTWDKVTHKVEKLYSEQVAAREASRGPVVKSEWQTGQIS
ncbi:MAG: glycosyltransferase family 4 protein [Nitrospiraceae bacterium]